MSTILKKAEALAAQKKTEVIAHRIENDKIIFVLRSGPKLQMTEDQLDAELIKNQPVETTAEKPLEKPLEKPKKKEK